MVARAGAIISVAVDCCGGVPFTDVDELESALAFRRIIPSSSSSSITIGELRDPVPTTTMTGEFERSCLGAHACAVFYYIISVVINGAAGLAEQVFIRRRKTNLL